MSSRLTKLAASYVPGTALPPSPHWGARLWGVVAGAIGCSALVLLSFRADYRRAAAERGAEDAAAAAECGAGGAAAA